MQIAVRESAQVTLTCPRCEGPLHEVVAVRVQATLGRRTAYGCPHCNSLLGISHRKGFWMG